MLNRNRMSVDFPRKLVDLLEPEVNWFQNFLSFTLVFWQKGGENGVWKRKNAYKPNLT